MARIGKETWIVLAQRHNQAVDHFVNVTLRNHFGSDTITVSQWFEANHLIQAQDFYKKGMCILRPLRAHGIDCKMDMQSNKLHCPEYGINAY